MPRYLNKKETDASGMCEPGRYLAEVASAKEKISKTSGVPMFEVFFKDVETGANLCYDNIMLGGKGAGIGVKKLKVLGVVEDDGEQYALPDDAGALVGKRCHVTIKHETYTANDGSVKKRSVVDFNAGSTFGYEPEHAAGSAIGTTPPVDDEIPF